MKRISLALGAPLRAVPLPPTTGPASYAAAQDGARDNTGRATLTGFAALPAQTFVPGSEPSGSQIGTTPINARPPPFAGQPVQGFSGIVRRGDGSFDVLSDNGYGGKNNSADFLLRVHRVRPDFKAGSVRVLGGFNLSDPRGRVSWPLTRADRGLTGADLDVEAIVRAAGRSGERRVGEG